MNTNEIEQLNDLTESLIMAECEHEREDIIAKLADAELSAAEEFYAEEWGQAFVHGALEQSEVIAGIVIINVNLKQIGLYGMVTESCLDEMTKRKQATEAKAAGASKPFVVSSAVVN